MIVCVKEWLLEVVSWDFMGVILCVYIDEWVYCVCNVFVWGYDWLYDDLLDDEYKMVCVVFLECICDIVEYVIQNVKIYFFLYDSYVVCLILFCVIFVCIVLLGDDEMGQVCDWLNYFIEFLYIVYLFWGDVQGGWVEGLYYWMIGIFYLLDVVNWLNIYIGLNVYQCLFF